MREGRGVLDTSVIIDLDRVGRDELPDECSIAAITLAELASGTLATRGARAVDLMVAATAAGAGLPLHTRNPDDFAGLEEVLRVVAVG